MEIKTDRPKTVFGSLELARAPSVALRTLVSSSRDVNQVPVNRMTPATPSRSVMKSDRPKRGSFINVVLPSVKCCPSRRTMGAAESEPDANARRRSRLRDSKSFGVSNPTLASARVGSPWALQDLNRSETSLRSVLQGSNPSRTSFAPRVRSSQNDGRCRI